MTTSVDWFEVIVPVGSQDPDETAAWLAQEVPLAAAGTEVRGDEIVFWVAEDARDAALAQVTEVAARWHEAGVSLPLARVRIVPALPEAEWRDAWKRYFKVSHLTRQFVVVPSWETYEPAPGEFVIDLDPGMAFGTGTHASTQLVLTEMQTLADEGITPSAVLDVGAGSGILAIAAAKRWPGARCVAIDNDPIAVDACRDNVAINKVTAQIACELTPLPELPGEFPLVLANIQAHVLRMLKTALVAKTAAGGYLIMSGILTPQAEPLVEEFRAAGLTLVGMRTGLDPAWTSITMRNVA